MSSARDLLSSSASDRNQIRELLQSVFVAELTSPSRVLWIVSPWISDIRVVDDASGAFSSLLNDHGSGASLTYTLGQLASRDTRVRVVTRPGENREFLAALERECANKPYESFVQVDEKEDLHTKGIVGDGYQITGSMNFTFNGVTKNDELVHFSTDPDQNARLKLEFESRYGK